MDSLQHSKDFKTSLMRNRVLETFYSLIFFFSSCDYWNSFCLFICSSVRLYSFIFAPIWTIRVLMDFIKHNGSFKTSLMPKRALEKKLCFLFAFISYIDNNGISHIRVKNWFISCLDEGFKTIETIFLAALNFKNPFKNF